VLTKYKHGLILGKFAPFHNGHKYLIDTAVEKCEKLTVLICSLPYEEIPGELRYQWLKEQYSTNSNVEIVHVVDTAREYPVNDNDDSFWDVWTGLIMREMFNKKFDVIFTSEEYGSEISKRMNFKYPNLKMEYYDVDKNRLTIPVSGTDVRTKTWDFWDYIPMHVRPYFMKKIIFMGPESCGKTVMSEKVSAYFDSECVPEFGRTYTDYLSDNELQIELRDFVKIAGGHSKLIRTVANNNVHAESINRYHDKLLFIDTDFITTRIWSEIYMRNISPELSEFENDYMQRGDVYFLMKPDVEWINDGTREFPHLREWHFDRIKKELEKRNLPFLIIEGNYEERYQMVMSHLIKLIGYWEANENVKILENQIFRKKGTSLI
jgi:HTH-type transcriptional repressor of NAD biosynthesis genes